VGDVLLTHEGLDRGADDALATLLLMRPPPPSLRSVASKTPAVRYETRGP